MTVPQLSETHLNQLLNHNKELNYYDSKPGKLSGFVNQVEQLLNLYPLFIPIIPNAGFSIGSRNPGKSKHL